MRAFTLGASSRHPCKRLETARAPRAERHASGAGTGALRSARRRRRKLGTGYPHVNKLECAARLHRATSRGLGQRPGPRPRARLASARREPRPFRRATSHKAAACAATGRARCAPPSQTPPSSSSSASSAEGAHGGGTDEAQQDREDELGQGVASLGFASTERMQMAAPSSPRGGPTSPRGSNEVRLGINGFGRYVVSKGCKEGARGGGVPRGS
jgi:hypothetical protein